MDDDFSDDTEEQSADVCESCRESEAQEEENDYELLLLASITDDG